MTVHTSDDPKDIIFGPEEIDAVKNALLVSERIMADYRKLCEVDPDTMNKPLDAPIRLQEQRRSECQHSD